MYLSKQSTIPIHTLSTMPTIPCSNPRLYDANNHQPNCTPSTFPNHLQFQSIHEVPFQVIHNPIAHAGYRPWHKSYSEHLSKPSTFPFRTQGTFPSHPHSQFVRRVPCQTPTGQLPTRRIKDHNSTSNKMENLNKVSSYISSNDSTITKVAGLSKTILHRHKSSN
jgi:hypothetical protein